VSAAKATANSTENKGSSARRRRYSLGALTVFNSSCSPETWLPAAATNTVATGRDGARAPPARRVRDPDHHADQVLNTSRLHGDDVYNRSVNTQILRLRRKIETDPAKPRYICTERDAGYVFSVRVEIIY
jgi:hypothetical protein